MKQNYIGVVDCNNFFVSCERLFRPDLWKKPVLVLSNNDGCVVARSQEVKDLGVPMGIPHFQIKDLIKSAKIAVFSSNFSLYRNISRRIFSLVEKEVDQFEAYSIDEGFFSIAAQSEEDALLIIQTLRQKLEMMVGIPVAIGLAKNKTLAKYANSLAKKGQNGVKLLNTEEWAEMSSEVKLNQIWGVGGRMSQRYRDAGLETVEDLLKADTAFIKSRFGISGLRLQSDLRGEVVTKISADKEEQKSLTHSRSTSKAVFKKTEVESVLLHHIEKAVAALRRRKLLAGSIYIFAYPPRHVHGKSISQLVPLVTPTNDEDVFFKIAQSVVNQQYSPESGYKKLGVTCGELLPEKYLSRSLFTTNEDLGKSELLKTIDSLNRRFGEDTIHRAATLDQSWRPNSVWRSPAYLSSWKDIPSASA